MGRRGLAVQVDISSKTSVDELVANVVESLGSIDILMNVAVINSHRKSLPELDEDGWDRLTDVIWGYWLML